jgi:release factor glutamine methyltransferase
MYPASEDSYFFADFLEKNFSKISKSAKSKIKFLDMGTGSGILAETAIDAGIKNVLSADINPEAVAGMKKRKINAVQTNLFSKIKTKFDIIVFNAPYLPQDKDEPKESCIETTGGKKGDEISVKFLKQALKHLNKNGKIYLLISSLTPFNNIKKFSPKILVKKKLWFEELMILEINQS